VTLTFTYTETTLRATSAAASMHAVHAMRLKIDVDSSHRADRHDRVRGAGGVVVFGDRRHYGACDPPGGPN